MSDFICDTHVHSKYSCDSEEELEAYCAKALRDGVKAICFTEHIDYNESDLSYNYYDRDKFFGDFLALKDKYKDLLSLLCGIEFSEPHLARDELSEYQSSPYDFILGSVHYLYKDMFPSVMVKEKVPAEICYKSYWDEVLKAVRCGGFDSLAHIDFPKRYYGQVIIDSGKLNEICGIMVKNNICLEINTSSLRKGLSESMPGKEILAIYKSRGGKYVTVGSDAHKAEDLAAGHQRAGELIAYFGFERVIFRKRQPSII